MSVKVIYRRNHRTAAGLSLRELANIVGVSFSSIARCERGVGTTTSDTAARLNQWVANGGSSPKKERRGTPWIVTVEQRLTAIEARLRELGGEP